MDTVSKLNNIISEYSDLEDSFIKKSLSQIELYKDFIKKYSSSKRINKRLTLYSEDSPMHKYLANIKPWRICHRGNLIKLKVAKLFALLRSLATFVSELLTKQNAEDWCNPKVAKSLPIIFYHSIRYLCINQIRNNWLSRTKIIKFCIFVLSWVNLNS